MSGRSCTGRAETTDEWEQLKLLYTWSEQARYELIRPTVLFDLSPAKRARETETSDGLRIALQNLMRISVPSGVDSELVFEGEGEHLPDYVRDQLYMVLREEVRNAVAHSGSESIVVEVNISPREVEALVWDHGQGFETSKAVSEGVGLSSMRERAELLGGSFEVASQGERGTVLRVRLPLMREKGR